MFEVFPEGHKQILEARDLLVLEYMRKYLIPFEYYSRDEIYDILRPTELNDLLVSRGFGGFTRMGRRDRTNLISVLNNLWWNDRVRKFAEGIFAQSGRPYGVRWMIET